MRQEGDHKQGFDRKRSWPFRRNWINRWQNSWRQSLVTQKYIAHHKFHRQNCPAMSHIERPYYATVVTQWAGRPENYRFDSHRRFFVARRPTQRLTQSTNGGSFHQDTAAGIAKENHSPARSTEVKKAWSSPPYLLVALRLSKHRVN